MFNKKEVVNKQERFEFGVLDKYGGRILKPGEGRRASFDDGLVQLKADLKRIEKRLRREKWKHYFRHPIKALTAIYLAFIGLFDKKTSADFGWSSSTSSIKNDDGTTTIEYRDSKNKVIRKEILYLSDADEEKIVIGSSDPFHDKKSKVYDLAITMRDKKLIEPGKSFTRQIDEMMKFEDTAFESYKKMIMKYDCDELMKKINPLTINYKTNLTEDEIQSILKEVDIELSKHNKE